MLDNERCILCSRCVRFTREISKSNALGIVQRGDTSLVRAADDHPLDADPYSDNIIDLCPVGALLSQPFLYKSRVWYLEPTPSVCPGCARGCSVSIWHRKTEWKLHALDPKANARIDRVTPRENPEVNGPWICNKGRDLARIFERPRATAADAEGQARRSRHGARRRAAPDRRREAAAGARVELGLQRGARGVQARAAGALHRLGQGGPCAAARRASRRRSPDPRRQEPEHRRGARALPAAGRRRARVAGATPTWCWSGARASTSPACRRRRGSSSSTPTCSRRTGTPTCSFRSASRPSGAATTRTSRAW